MITLFYFVCYDLIKDASFRRIQNGEAKKSFEKIESN